MGKEVEEALVPWEVEEALVPCRLQRGSHPEVGTEGMTANHSLNLLRMMV